MSEENEMGSAQPNDAVGGGQGGMAQDAGSADQEQQQQAGRGESRLLGEVKSLKAKLADAQSLVEQSQLRTLEAEGNKDKQIEFLKNENNSLKSTIQQKDKSYAFATLGSQVKTEAVKMGCVSPEDLVKHLDLESIPVDPDSFTGDTDSIRILLEDQKKSRPFFFSKQAPQVHDVAQQNKILNAPEKDTSKMTREELAEMVNNLGSEQF